MSEIRGWTRGVGAAVLAVLLFVGTAHAAYPPITDAEKAASEIVADHLARGSVAFADRIASGSPFATLSRDELMRELEARVGPRDGALWELRTTTREFAAHGAVFYVVFPSGADDVVTLDLVRVADRWMLRDIRTLAEVPIDKLRNAPPPEVVAPPVERPGPSVFFLLLLGPFLAIPGAALRHHFPRATSGILALAFLTFVLALGTSIDPQWKILTQRKRATRVAAQPMLRLGALSGLRAATARGTKTLELPSSTDVTAKEVAALWIAANSVGAVPPDQVRARLDTVAVLRDAPLASLIRARLAAHEGETAAARDHFAAIHRITPAHDTFAIEELLVAEVKTPPALIETRDPNLYYTRILQELITRDATAVRKAFQEAWSLQPVSRSSLVSSGIFSLLLADQGLASLVNLNSPVEQALPSVDFRRSPLTIPRGATASVCGAYLRIAIGNARLDISGGSRLAPADTRVLTADELEREESAQALRLAQSLGSPSLGSAAMQRTVEYAAEALAARNRWQDIVTLTQSIRHDSEGLPLPLIIWRTSALVRLKQYDDARQLATGRAAQNPAGVGADVGSLIELSELMAKAGAWDDALALVRRASQVKGAPDISGNLRRLELRKTLSASPVLSSTPHFAIHATQDVPVTVAERVGQLLEAELQRVSGVLSASEFQPIRVNVTRWDEFSEQLTGSDHIVGFYDGEITVPFGEVGRFRESVVAILTHELTHAIIAQQSADNAPRWFQEGLARRMELVERQENIFQLHRDQQFVALSVLDATLGESLDPQAVGDAYTVGATLMRFIEDRHGSDAIPRLIAAFREGKDTNEALMAALQVRDLSALDVEFRQWGLTHAEAFIDRTPWPYWKLYSPGIDPSIRNNIRFSRDKNGARP